MDIPARLARPGLAKVRSAPLSRTRSVELVATSDGRWRDILERADVVSEGKARQEGAGLVYYGSTSLVIPELDAAEVVRGQDPARVAELIRCDPHVRVRAIRLAWREAAVRAAAPIGVLRAEITVHATARGIALSIDVVAKVRAAPASAPRSAR